MWIGDGEKGESAYVDTGMESIDVQRSVGAQLGDVVWCRWLIRVTSSVGAQKQKCRLVVDREREWVSRLHQSGRRRVQSAVEEEEVGNGS